MKTEYIYLLLCEGSHIPKHDRHPSIPKYVYGSLLAPPLKEEQVFICENPNLDSEYFVKIGITKNITYCNYNNNIAINTELNGKDLEIYNKELNKLDLHINED